VAKNQSRVCVTTVYSLDSKQRASLWASEQKVVCAAVLLIAQVSIKNLESCLVRP
jgi:uncharacterized protein YsxB (DUF464 family)